MFVVKECFVYNVFIDVAIPVWVKCRTCMLSTPNCSF